MFADYQSPEGNFRVEYSELDSALIDQLVEEIQSA
jgi:hypothetical protein